MIHSRCCIAGGGPAGMMLGFLLARAWIDVVVLEDGGRISGVRANTAEGMADIPADLVGGADGRHSIVREKAGLPVDELGEPMDVLWFRVSRQTGDGEQTLGHISKGKMMVMLNRDDYWQCAYLIRKGDFDRIKEAGLPAFHNDVVSVVPFLRDRMSELRTWDDIKLLTVRVDRLRKWYRPGLLCIGDAAHAMSPIGGVVSISQFRTPSPPRIFWPRILHRLASQSRISNEFSRAVNCRRESHRPCRFLFKIG